MIYVLITLKILAVEIIGIAAITGVFYLADKKTGKKIN